VVRRTLQSRAVELAGRHPVITITGPRQSGKTTLCRGAFASLPYVSLEPPDERAFAASDPRGFLARFGTGAVIDEVQRVPDLASYLQPIVDADPRPGRFVLTGSQSFTLMQSLTQTLAGRSAMVELFPLGLEEIRRFPSVPADLNTLLWTGGYPRIFDRGLPPQEWLGDYVATYVERDVRQVLNVGDLLTFQTFLRMCAARAGQLLNLSALGADCGITHATARQWLSVLEASYIVFRLPPLHANLGKRLIKTPKLYFHDSGLLCYLLGIREPGQLAVHPLRGAIFESWVIADVLKHHRHRGVAARLFFYRDRAGTEVDLVIERGADRLAVEIKAGMTPSPDAFAAPDRVALALTGADTMPTRAAVVYGGADTQTRSAGELISWSDVDRFAWLGHART
jgi:hypothetical protein